MDKDFVLPVYRQEDPYTLTQEEEQLMNLRLQVYNRLVEKFPISMGKEASKQYRDINQMTESTLTYGEIEFWPFAEVFDTLRGRYQELLQQGGIFYDLGSGTGKAVMAAALLHHFDECRGIEIVDHLYDISINLKNEYEQVMPEFVQQGLYERIVPIQFFKDSFFDRDFSDASFIFANSTCFSDEMMEQIASRPLRPGTIGISFTRSFPGQQWEILESIRKNMSWGEATVYIQRVKTDQSPMEWSNT